MDLHHYISDGAIGSGKYHQVVIKHDCGSLNSEPTKNQVGA